ncbi:hypothetical protein CC85DRAFT_51173 [Cutaneotrichosporon oleaginosum]|uniref:Uncharacterized protein n=1 Tax=Cutaneotrichosporon oleaginosum TaxID=879819 RepID=A0A0J0XAX9_9TREE|nr:uncharacterized protein CC85DRAFT_51173 [Cutaneotrichosporon oleaginosum]KLT38267.1 hypothetical protein CC85DRAFT_51173 [Cutaneotrichosporon oleaginosum]TXT05880.1 hypothetical protein COLE_07200 [Cutaneotrichosporon oleaginosum]TXT06762.1 hypothetical protein COLE_06093 [Cutaneotrichosporon oleaginosum]TXT13863.1 hypothetical protein COLE_00056 [Cutaneotrichosporon oleaginosum]TXT15461.1 hypothetical protein COLE_01654 [Cutaneotrichosporon oleaginosum]
MRSMVARRSRRHGESPRCFFRTPCIPSRRLLLRCPRWRCPSTWKWTNSSASASSAASPMRRASPRSVAPSSSAYRPCENVSTQIARCSASSSSLLERTIMRQPCRTLSRCSSHSGRVWNTLDVSFSLWDPKIRRRGGAAATLIFCSMCHRQRTFFALGHTVLQARRRRLSRSVKNTAGCGACTSSTKSWRALRRWAYRSPLRSAIPAVNVLLQAVTPTICRSGISYLLVPFVQSTRSTVGHRSSRARALRVV